MLILIVFSFILYYILSVYYFENMKGTNRLGVLVLIFAVVAVIIGIRNPLSWSDTTTYYWEFVDEFCHLETGMYGNENTCHHDRARLF